MKLKIMSAAVTAALAVALLGATGASAATEVGSKCGAVTTGGPNTWISLANGPASPIAPTVPTAGVITRWTFTVGVPGLPPGYSASLKILRGTGVAKQFQTVADTGLVPVTSGINSFAARTPVKAGDFIGTYGTQPGGTPSTLICAGGNPADKAAVIENDVPLNATGTAVAEPESLQIPIVAFVEPDADNDGFGDETQDLCPTSAAVQTVACPLVGLSTDAQIKGGSVTVLVASNTAAPVTVKGVAKLSKGKTAKLNGGTQSLVPSTITKFRLLFSRALKSRLKELPPKKSVKLNVTVSGTSVAGVVSTKTLKLKLKGKAKP